MFVIRSNEAIFVNRLTPPNAFFVAVMWIRITNPADNVLHHCLIFEPTDTGLWLEVFAEPETYRKLCLKFSNSSLRYDTWYYITLES